MQQPQSPERDERVNWVRSSIPFFLVHAPAASPCLHRRHDHGRSCCSLVMFFGRMFFVTAGYHRYFSHKSYKLNRFWQFVMAFGGEATAQKGVALVGRQPPAPPPLLRHRARPPLAPQGLLVEPRRLDPLRQVQADADTTAIKDFAKYPELRFINKHDWIAPWTLGVACFLIGGWSGLRHRVLLVDGAAVARHVPRELAGARVRSAPLRDHRHQPQHAARRAAHRRRGLAQQPPPLPVVGPPGFFWWEIDITYYMLKALQLVGIVRDLRQPPRGCASRRLAPSGDDAETREPVSVEADRSGSRPARARRARIARATIVSVGP